MWKIVLIIWLHLVMAAQTYRKSIKDTVPRCVYKMKHSRDEANGRTALMPKSVGLEEFLPPSGSNLAHFVCQCNANQYRGTLSKVLSDPLSALPWLHLSSQSISNKDMRQNVTILVEIEACSKLRLGLDVTQLLQQRAISSSTLNFIIKVRLISIFKGPFGAFFAF